MGIGEKENGHVPREKSSSVLVVAAVIVREGRVLACQRSRNGRFALKWEFPGGKVQRGETPEGALERELMEELGVQAKTGMEIYRARHKYEGMREPIELIFFEARVGWGAIENRIFERIEWLAPQELRQKDFLQADRELIEKLANGEINIEEETRP